MTSNDLLAPSLQMATFDLFSVTPIGIVIVLMSIVYFMVFGRYVLPDRPDETGPSPEKATEYFEKTYGIAGDLFEAKVTIDSPLVGLDIEEIETRFDLPFILAVRNGDEVIVAPPRDQIVWVNTILGLMGSAEQMASIANEYSLALNAELTAFAETLNASQAGIAELVIPQARASTTTVGSTPATSLSGMPTVSSLSPDVSRS